MNQTKDLIKLRLALLNDMNDTSKDDLFEMYLEDATSIAAFQLYPFDIEKTVDTSNPRIANWIVRCAIELYNYSDRSGVSRYGENGLSVEYLSSIVNPNLLNELIPKAGVPK